MSNIYVKSEIGKLKKVLLHRPGKELLNLTPDTLSELLFDDIPYLQDAQKEHDAFAKALIDNGIEVVYLEDLVSDVIGSSEKIRDKFIKQFIKQLPLIRKEKSFLFKRTEKYLHQELHVNPLK